MVRSEDDYLCSEMAYDSNVSRGFDTTSNEVTESPNDAADKEHMHNEAF